MSTTSNRKVVVTFTGDVNAALGYNALVNITSPGEIQILDLAIGANTITLPAGSVSATILPPANNLSTITLKGVAGDTGIAVHLTDPLVLTFKAGVTNFVLNASAIITGLRIIWA